ncbi:MAG: folate-binding protein [Alphaproteobacteria bacterium]|nr:folate-binding protein [Alphaproteobacteria bacterium]
MVQVAHLPARGVIEISGEDRVSFLQGLVSNDVAQAAPGRAVWAALLTPQGKWLADFFILSDGARLLLDAEALQVAMIVQRLGRFRLRAKATLRDASAELSVFVAWHGAPAPPAGATAAPDPRVEAAGWRILAPAMAANATAEDWDRHRLSLGLPDGSADMEAEKSVLLEAGFDELNGVSWSKGCYMGQELTARTKYRGLVKRRLVSVDIEGAAPDAGTPVLLAGAEVGTLRSSRDGRGLATLRLEALRAPALECGPARLRPAVPGWLKLPG